MPTLRAKLGQANETLLFGKALLSAAYREKGYAMWATHAIVKYPTRRLTVVVLANRRGGAPDEIARTITRLASFRQARE